MVRCFVSHIGTKVLVPLTTHLIVILTVTASECLMDFVGSIDSDKVGRSRGSITATIHLLDTGQSTTVNDDFCILVCICRFIHSQVTTTIDSKYVILLVSYGIDVIRKFIILNILYLLSFSIAILKGQAHTYTKFFNLCISKECVSLRKNIS